MRGSLHSMMHFAAKELTEYLALSKKFAEFLKPHFSRALDVAGVRLSADELQMLYDEYGSANGLDVDYQIFCDEMDDVFTTKGLESMPTMEVSTPVLFSASTYIVAVSFQIVLICGPIGLNCCPRSTLPMVLLVPFPSMWMR